MRRLQQRWSRLPGSVRWGVSLFVCARIVWTLWGAMVMTLLPTAPSHPIAEPPVPEMTGVLGWAMEPWNRWDVRIYLRIAAEGYGVADGRGSKAPLFPVMLGILGHALDGRYLLAAFLISDLTCLASLILLYEIAQREGYNGRRTVVALLLYPFAFFLFVPYTESMLLFFILLSFWFARSGRWWLVGISGGLAVLTKVTALVLLLPLAWEVWQARRRRSIWNGLWLAILPAASVGWAIVRQWQLAKTGTPLSSTVYGIFTLFMSPDFQVGWGGTRISWPWASLGAAIEAPFQLGLHPYLVPATADLIVIGLVTLLTCLCCRLRPPSFPIYAVSMFVLNLLLVVPHVPLIDAPRRWLPAFPLFIAAATDVPSRWNRPLTFASGLLQAILSLLFVKWAMVG